MHMKLLKETDKISSDVVRMYVFNNKHQKIQKNKTFSTYAVRKHDVDNDDADWSKQQTLIHCYGKQKILLKLYWVQMYELKKWAQISLFKPALVNDTKILFSRLLLEYSNLIFTTFVPSPISDMRRCPYQKGLQQFQETKNKVEKRSA